MERDRVKGKCNVESATPSLSQQSSAATCWQIDKGQQLQHRWKHEAGPVCLGHGSSGSPEASQGPDPGLASAGNLEKTLASALAPVLVDEPNWDSGGSQPRMVSD